MASMYDKTKDMIGSIGALQTLTEQFPMKLLSLGDYNFSSSFDILGLLFKALRVEREDVIEVVTNFLTGKMNSGSEDGFIAYAEEIIKTALEANIINILNCTTNPIISNDLIYNTDILGTNIKEQGEGININLSEIDFSGVLKHNPCSDEGSKFYFDVSGYTANDVYKSKDFNAYLWWIINRGDATQISASTWDNRYNCSLWGNNNEDDKKNIIVCNYIDNGFPLNDTINVHLCPETYYKQRKFKVKGKTFGGNKTIFEFNHDYLTSVKLFDPKVIVTEVVEYILGNGGLTVNVGISFDEMMQQQKIDQIIDKVIKSSDTEINDCFFSFSNEEYNDMLVKAEAYYANPNNSEVSSRDILSRLSGVTNNSTLEENKTILKDIIYEISATGASTNASANISLNYDWFTDIMRAFVYPIVRPLFSPKILFLLVLNKKIMGSVEDLLNHDEETTMIENLEEKFEDILESLWYIIKDVIVKLKELVVDLFLQFIMDKITPLLELFASRLLAETLKMYKDLLNQILEECLLGWNNNGVAGAIDNVNYAEITPEQVEPEQSIC